MNIKGLVWRRTHLPKKIKKLKKKIKKLYNNTDETAKELLRIKDKYTSLLKNSINLSIENKKLQEANDYNTMIIVSLNSSLMELERRLESTQNG